MSRTYSLEKGRSDYLTPAWIEQAIRKFSGREFFDMDVCCSEMNIPAKMNLDLTFVDGLQAFWYGLCWMNPPYDELGKWIKKAYEESQKGAEVWCVFPNRTETAYFHRYILTNPNCFRVILQKNKDLGFLHPETKEFVGQYKNPLCICYFGKNAKEYAQRWSIEQPIKGCVAIGVQEGYKWS